MKIIKVFPLQPWDTTEIWVGDLNDKGTAIIQGTARKVSRARSHFL